MVEENYQDNGQGRSEDKIPVGFSRSTAEEGLAALLPMSNQQEEPPGYALHGPAVVAGQASCACPRQRRLPTKSWRRKTTMRFALRATEK